MTTRKLIFVAILLTGCEDKLNWIKNYEPVVYSITPDAGSSGTTVTITGANFDILPYKNTVMINKTRATVTDASSTALKFIAPDESTGPVVVIVNNKKAANQPVFTYE